jgi:hypothetical protein
VALAFDQVSFEEKHALMTGAAKFPDWFVEESLKEHHQGSNGTTCNGCNKAEAGACGFFKNHQGQEKSKKCNHVCEMSLIEGTCICSSQCTLAL